MSSYLAKNVGRWLFPHLARDQRKRQIRTILLILFTTGSGLCGLLMWMLSGRH